MSLTRQVKNELVRIEEASTCCGSWELKALIIRQGFYTINSNMHILSISADSGALARRIFKLLKKAGIQAPAITRQEEKRLTRSRYLVQVQGREQIDALLIYLGLKEAGELIRLPRLLSSVPRRSCCRKAFARGAFLAGGSVSVSSRSGYHLEINCGSQDDAVNYQKVLRSFDLDPLIRQRNDSAFIYLKNAESIADYLRIVGAGSTLLKFESLRVMKSMRGQVNRLVNCDTANLEKVVQSARQHLNMIEELDRLVGLNNLTPALKEAAVLRMKHPEASLKELGEMADPPLSKSAVNHRFRQMEKMIASKRKTAGGSAI